MPTKSTLRMKRLTANFCVMPNPEIPKYFHPVRKVKTNPQMKACGRDRMQGSDNLRAKDLAGWKQEESGPLSKAGLEVDT